MRITSFALLAAGTILIAACSQNNTQPQTVTLDTNDDAGPRVAQVDRAPQTQATSKSPYATDPFVRQSIGTFRQRVPAVSGPRGVQYRPAASVTPNQRTHVVQNGETLYSIAKRYYKDGKQWRRILNANRQNIDDTGSIGVGTKLIIP